MTVYYCDGVHSKTERGENVCLYQIELLTDRSKTLRSVTLAEEAEVDPRIALCKTAVVK